MQGLIHTHFHNYACFCVSPDGIEFAAFYFAVRKRILFCTDFRDLSEVGSGIMGIHISWQWYWDILIISSKTTEKYILIWFIEYITHVQYLTTKSMNIICCYALLFRILSMVFMLHTIHLDILIKKFKWRTLIEGKTPPLGIQT